MLTLAWPLVRFRRHRYSLSHPPRGARLAASLTQGMVKSSHQARKQASTVNSNSVARCLWKQ